MKTPNLELVEVAEGDTPAYADINDAYHALDAIVQLTVIDKDLTVPPAAPVQGDRYIVPSDATGAWASKTGRIAYQTVNGWEFRVPRVGWIAWVADEESPYVYTDDGWDVFFSASSSAALPNFSGGHAEEGFFELNFSLGGAHELTLLGDVTISIVGATAGKVNRTHLITRQDSVGGRTITWPAGTFWAHGAPPPLNTQINAVHVFEVSTYDGGITLYARLLAGTVFSGDSLPARYPTTEDPFWPYVSYLMHMDGANGASVFTEERGHAVTVVSSDETPITTTANKKFGTASAKFSSPSLPAFDPYSDPTKVNYLSFPAAPENDLSVVDFTFECWVRDPGGTAATGNTHTIFMKPGPTISDPQMIAFSYLGILVFAYATNDPATEKQFSPQPPPPLAARIVDTEFRHIFVSRKAGVIYFGVNGTRWTDGTVRAAAPGTFSTQPFNIGGGYSQGGSEGDYYYADLEIDESRLTVGQARYCPESVPSPAQFTGTYTVPVIEFDTSPPFVPEVKTPRRTIGAHWPSPAEAQDISVRLPYAALVSSVTILTQGGPGDCVCDIWAAPFVSYPPTDANSIVGTVPPAMVGGTTFYSETLDDWDRDLEIGDVVTFHLESSDVLTSITLLVDLEEKA